MPSKPVVSSIWESARVRSRTNEAGLRTITARIHLAWLGLLSVPVLPRPLVKAEVRPARQRGQGVEYRLVLHLFFVPLHRRPDRQAAAAMRRKAAADLAGISLLDCDHMSRHQGVDQGRDRGLVTQFPESKSRLIDARVVLASQRANVHRRGLVRILAP